MMRIAFAAFIALLCGHAAAQTPISALPSATVPLVGTEVAPIVQGGTTKKVALSPANLGALGATLDSTLQGAGTSGSPLGLASIGASTVLGNSGGTSAQPAALSQSQLTTLINQFTATLPGVAPASGGGTTNFLRADGTWAAPPSGSGTVSSVALSLPGIFTVSGSPVTSTGTLTGTLATQSANQVWAGPTTGAAAAPAFRALVTADMPAGTGTVTSVATSGCATGGTITGSGTITVNQKVGNGGAFVTGSSYPIQAADGCTDLIFNSATANMPVTLPVSTTAGFGYGYGLNIVNASATNSIIVTPTTSTFQPSGTTSLTIPSQSSCAINVTPDGNNYYFGYCPAAQSGFLALTGGTLTGPLQVPPGTVSVPGLQIGSANVGIENGSSDMRLTTAGAVRLTLASAGQVISGGSSTSRTLSNNGTTLTPLEQLQVGNSTGIAKAYYAYNATASSGPFIYLGHSASNTVGANSAITSGGVLGTLFFGGNDATTMIVGAGIRAEANANFTTNTSPTRLIFSTHTTAANTSVDAFKIDPVQHLVFLGPAPTATCGGNSATIVGNDKAGRITAPATPGTSCTVTFAGGFTTNAPVCKATDETLGLDMPVTTVSVSAVTFTLATLAVGNSVSYGCGGFE